MAKAKKKDVVVDDNEFLRGLMDEVKAIEEDSRIEIAEGLSPEDLNDAGILPGHMGSEAYKGEANILGGLYDKSTRAENEDVPTAFRSIQAQMDKADAVVMAAAKPNKPPPAPASSSSSSDKTKAIESTSTQPVIHQSQADRTIAVEGARSRPPALPTSIPAPERSQITSAKAATRPGQVYIAPDASLAQAETLRLAQERIKELEVEVDRLRQDNDDLASAGEIITQKMEDLQGRAMRVEKEKTEVSAQLKNELLILKGHLQFKDNELSKARTKIEDLDLRIKTDFKKIRVRERELENRLELVRAEKHALMRSKDEKILELQRKVDQLKSELDLYRTKVQDLNKFMEDQQDQMRKTVRALRVALSNLEHESPLDDNRSVVAQDPDKPKNESES